MSSTANLCFLKSKAQPLQPLIPKPQPNLTQKQSAPTSSLNEPQADTTTTEEARTKDGDATGATAASRGSAEVAAMQANSGDGDAPSASHAHADSTSTPEPRRSARKRPVVDPAPEPAKRMRVSDDNSSGIIATMKNAVKRGIAAIFRNTIIGANSAAGIHILEWDAIRTASWAIVASTGAVSDTHPDAAGYLTWIKADVGAKIWVYVQPNKPAKDMKTAMEAYFNMVESNTDPRKLATLAVPVQTLLTPGMLV